jgi:hypothetical protein
MTKKEHGLMAAHHVNMAVHHDKAADFHGQLAKSADPEASAGHAGLQACHKAMASEHESESARHLEHCKSADDELDKSAGSIAQELTEVLRDLKKFLSCTTVPLASGLSLIPRFGARDPRAEKDSAVSKVDPSLRHVISDPTEAAPSSVEWTTQRQ